MEKGQFFLAFGFQRGEILLMCHTQRGEDAYRRLDNIAQSCHLTRLTDTGLEHSHLRILVHQPHRQRHANLRVVGARRSGYGHLRRQQLINPLLHDGLSVGAGYADDRNIELVAVALRQPLQSLARTHDLQEVRLRELFLPVFRHILYHKVTYSTPIQVRNIVKPIVASGLQSEEKRFFRKAKRAAICQHKAYLRIAVAIASCSDECRYFLNTITHTLHFVICLMQR